ncbi:uncharacterized protein KY384_002079 [Bacidia gigantensis]|uniref:uncharacterized protein n=1 Tax=Bacidia gigantensis TaxID=2732470 RepID=UPI001D039BE0|nr:uncharacterized protein KY384_002079 [Bacidia gigantensis]KAG8533296.1 hypothetical protein KY384_002079 [Bacidia gigantensis]
MIHLSKPPEDETMFANSAIDSRSRRASATKGPRRRSSALRFFASNSPPKPETPAQSHKQWESDYLKGLRANHPTRPSGSRPLPTRNGATSEPFTRAASALSFRPTLSKPEQGDLHPVIQERATSALSHRRAQSDMSKVGHFSSLTGRTVVQTPHALRSTRDFSASTAEIKGSPERSPVAYRESGMRWMEKQEARSLREALEDMDVRIDARIHAGAQDEASELVLDHTSDNLPNQFGRARRDYTKHLKEGAHARSQSKGWYDKFKSPIENEESRGNPAKEEWSSRSRDPHPDERELKADHQRKTSNEKQEPQQRTHVKWDSPEKKTYTSLAFQVPALKTSRRRSSGTKRRQPSGGPFQNPNDKIYEDSHTSNGHVPKRTTSSRIPVPLYSKTTNSLDDSRPPMMHPNSSAKIPNDTSSPAFRAEIHRNPPSQSHNPTYTTNQSQKRDEAIGEQHSDRSVQSEDGKEVRSEDIRAATSMRFMDRSPKLPKPAFVSEQPGRHIVSFDKDWKPKHPENRKDSINNRDAENIARERPRLPPLISAASAPVVPTICVPDVRSPSADDALKTRKTPSISVTANQVPVISLPEEQSEERPLPARLDGNDLSEEKAGETAIDDGDDSLRFYCHLDFHELFSPRCRNCKTPIESEVVVACGGTWHVGHFFCAECGDPFDSKTPFVEKNGSIFIFGSRSFSSTSSFYLASQILLHKYFIVCFSFTSKLTSMAHQTESSNTAGTSATQTGEIMTSSPLPSTIYATPNGTTFKDLLESGKYTDMTISCGEDIYKLHKLVICPQSSFFEKACMGPFKEATSRVIDLSHDEANAVKRMVSFLYTTEYDDSPPSLNSKSSMGVGGGVHPVLQIVKSNKDKPIKALYKHFRVPRGPRRIAKLIARYDAKEIRKTEAPKTQVRLINNIAVYAVASKYDIKPLKDLARIKFAALLGPYGLPLDFPTVVEKVLSSTPESDEGLREVVSDKCCKLGKWVCGDKSMRNALVGQPEFASDLLQSILFSQDAKTAMVKSGLQEVSSGLLKILDTNTGVQANGMINAAKFEKFKETLDDWLVTFSMAGALGRILGQKGMSEKQLKRHGLLRLLGCQGAASAQVITNPGHDDMIHDAVLDYYGRRLATCSSDRTVKVFEVEGESHKLTETLQGHEGAVWCVSWAHPKYGTILASSSYDGKVLIWRESPPQGWQRVADFSLHTASVNIVSWSPHESGCLLACASSDGKVSVLEFQEGNWSHMLLEAHGAGVNAVSWAPAMVPGQLVSAKPDLAVVRRLGPRRRLVAVNHYGKVIHCVMLTGQDGKDMDEHAGSARNMEGYGPELRCGALEG